MHKFQKEKNYVTKRNTHENKDWNYPKIEIEIMMMYLS
jgi:hypothetical protein